MPSPLHIVVGILMALVAVTAIQSQPLVWTIVAVLLGILVAFILVDLDRRR